MRTGSPALGGICVVLGAGGTLGNAVTKAFTQAGAQVVGADLQESPGVIECDVTDEASVAAVFAYAAHRGEICHVVHAAGLAAVSAVSEADLGDVRRLLEVNLVSCFVTAKHAVGRLTAGHSLTFIASHAALYGSARWAAYSASKAGVVSLTQALAQETGRLGPRVNCVSPGSVESPMMDVALARVATERQLPVEEIRREAELASPLARFATPEEVAGVCVFLASPAAGYITGANIVINGGERPG